MLTMKPTLGFLFVSTLAFQIASSKMLNMTTETTYCTPEFPDAFHPCTLKCTLDLSGSGFKVDQHSFYYYTTDPFINVELQNVGDYAINVNYIYESNQVELGATLHNYNAGKYVCWVHLIHISNGTQLEAKYEFDIDSADSTGLLLGTSCSMDRQCWALDAQCHAVCECPSGYINYNGQADTPACLPHSANRCIKDEQCADGFLCENNICSYDNSGLSIGAIVGIVIACVVVIGLLIGLVIYHHIKAKKFWKNKRVVETALENRS